MRSIADYVRCAAKLRAVIGPHIVEVFNAGRSVVLDFQANTVQSRTWIKGLLAHTLEAHKLHVLDVPDAVCIARLHARIAEENHRFAATETQYWQLPKHFLWPTADDGSAIVMHPHYGA